jgi:hypothetical protein
LWPAEALENGRPQTYFLPMDDEQYLNMLRESTILAIACCVLITVYCHYFGN